MNSDEDLSFFIIRHVNNKKTNLYWKKCYECIRKYYTNKIFIIDDNSNNKYLTQDIKMENTFIINGEYPKRGEILGYYYFYKLNPSKKAIIIHDSVFFNKKINFNEISNNKIFWHFIHNWDNNSEIIEFIQKFNNNSEILSFFYDKKSWFGCFGMMMIIEWEFLDKIDKKYNFFNILLENTKNRNDRMNLERIISCIFTLNDNKLKDSYFGEIHKYCKWGIKWKNYINKNINLPLIKIWTGR
jgi:hypothetical protein